ncbi:MAG: hypothetical protein QOF14_2957 [Hyphomicrobiales bacterium]|nr:hypothetical protein [Hyphomicrobiales bacterium]
MTYHAELEPRRRPWLIAMPLVLVLALAAAWSGIWYYAAGEAEARVNDWQAQQAKAGRVFSCGSQKVGGFPFRIEVRCGDVAVELKDTQPPLAIKLKEIHVVAQVWDPKMLIAEFTGPLTAAEPGQPPVTATWTLAQASVRGTPATPERASIAIDDLKLDGPAPGNALFDAKHAEFHARMQYGSWPHNPAIDLAMKLNAATAPALGAYTREPLDADILAVLHGMKDLRPKPLPVRLREWQAAGGRVEIQNARVAQGEMLGNATGMLALTQRGGLEGALRLNVAGLEKLLPTLTGGERKGAPLGLDRVAPALNAIDRAVPGLGARVAPQAQNLAAGLLGLLGQQVEVEGKRGVSVPVRFTDGAASLGPIPLGQVPPAF